MTAELFCRGPRAAAGCAAALVCVFLFSSIPAGAQFFWDTGDGPFWKVGRDLQGGAIAAPPVRNLPLIGSRMEDWPDRLRIGAPAVVTNDTGAVFSLAEVSATQAGNASPVGNWRGGWLFTDNGFARQLDIVSGSGADPGNTNFYFGVISVTDPVTGSNMFVQLVDLRTNPVVADPFPIASQQTVAGVSQMPPAASGVVVEIVPSRLSSAPPEDGGMPARFSSRAAVINPNALQPGGTPGAADTAVGPATGGVLRLAGGFTNNVEGGPDSVGRLLADSEIQFSLIPEPSTAALGGGGVLLLVGRRRRKRLAR